jgi:hypothetical protein
MHVRFCVVAKQESDKGAARELQILKSFLSELVRVVSVSCRCRRGMNHESVRKRRLARASARDEERIKMDSFKMIVAGGKT